MRAHMGAVAARSLPQPAISIKPLRGFRIRAFAQSALSGYAPAMRKPTFLPIAMTMAGLASFSVMDGVMKAASIAVGAYPALFWRNLIGVMLMAPIWAAMRRRNGGGWVPRAPVLRLHLLRSSIAGVMATLFFWGTIHTPLAEAMALTFIAPLIALYLAAAFLGESMRRAAIGGSLMALTGVGVIAAGKLGPSDDPQALAGMIAILCSSVLYAANLVLQRRQAQLAGPDEIAFFQSLFIALLYAPGAWWLGVVPDAAQTGLIALGAVLAVISLMLIGWAYARAEAQALVPLEYTAFIWAALIGWLMFAEPVTWRTIAGVVLIVAGCLVAIDTRTDPADHAQPNPA